jgi:general nucleoside transport system ATP-binding protein
MNVHLEARKLSKHFGAFKAIDDVSLKILKGRIHAVIGENGAGKSTLMKMLFGLHTPTSGEIIINGEDIKFRSALDAIARGIGMVQQHFSLVPPLSAIDNIILGSEPAGAAGILDRRRAITRLQANLPSPKLEVPWDEKVERLSVGEKQRVEILKLIYRNAKLLILDEPTAVLTPPEIEDLFSVLRGMKSSGHTIVIISHKLREIFSLCDDFTVLRAGRVTSQGSLKDTNEEKMIEAMIGHRLPPVNTVRSAKTNETALKCEAVFSLKQGRGTLKGLDLDVHKGEIVGIAGVEGAGQKSLVNSIMGLERVNGIIEIFGQRVKSTRQVRDLGVGLVPEDRIFEGLWTQESAFNNMIIGLEENFSKAGFLIDKKIEVETTGWAELFDVRGASLRNSAASFSGGNQQKLIFAREVAGRKPSLLISHQPTRGVDLGAAHRIHERLVELRNQGLGVLILSSDLDEVMKLADRIYVFYDGKVAEHFERAQFDANKIGRAMAGIA